MYRFSLSCFSCIYINTHIPGLHLYPQAYLAFFVIDDLQMAQSAKALVSERRISVDHRTCLNQCFHFQIPAIIYICSFVVSVMLQVYKKFKPYSSSPSLKTSVLKIDLGGA